ncbi:hypothetical protein ACR6HW_08150 [Fusibacter sp. JL298sf-3]
MFASYPVFVKLLERYDYGGALLLLKDEGLHDTDAAHVVDSCRHAVNFNFTEALSSIQNVNTARQDDASYQLLLDNLKALNGGEPEALLSELLENLKFQIVNEEYIDFLGRVYRFKEAVYKYLFLKTQMKDRPFTFQSRFMQKKEILKVLRNHYKIYNNHLVYALNSYFHKYVKNDSAIDTVLETMNTKEMNQLIELRHDSLIGHGFKGVSLEEIQRVYGDPYHVLDDFKACIKALHISVFRYKYSVINEFVLNWLNDEIRDGGGNTSENL